MKVIAQEEIERLHLAQAAPRAAHPQVMEIRRAVSNLEVGQGLQVEKQEWPLKNAPTPQIFRYGHHKYKVRTMADKNGWVVIRIN